MASSAPANDPVAIRQWVACVALVLEAEEAAARATAVDRAIALIVADTAVESALALMSSRNMVPVGGDDFGTYLSRAVAIARIPDRQERELRSVHKLRNGAIHHAADVTEGDVARATAAARTLLDDYVPRVLKKTHALRSGSGIGDAVGSLLDPHPIGRYLVEAQAGLRRGDPAVSLESTARAFRAIRGYAQPGLPFIKPASLVYEAFKMQTVTRRDYVRNRVDELSSGLHGLENWMIPLALGMSPPLYASLQASLPKLFNEEAVAKWTNDDPTPSVELARQALERVATVALRFWLNGLLRYPDPTYKPISRWDEITG